MAFPALCHYYDQFFFANKDLSQAMQKEDEMLLLAFQQGSSMENWTAFNTVDDLAEMTNMTSSQFTMFLEEILTYCKANLVRIIVYIPSPYVTTYKTDQVAAGSLFQLFSSPEDNCLILPIRTTILTPQIRRDTLAL